MIHRLLDRISLRPTRHAIPAAGLGQEPLPLAEGAAELFTLSVPREGAEWHVLKFVGSSGRAENVTEHPFDAWPGESGSIYVANPPGYGRSPGRASLAGHLATARALYAWFSRRHPGQVPLLMGNSLGGAVALQLASEVPCRGIIVRDSPHLPAVIRSRYRFAPRLAGWFADQAASQLDALSAARQCEVPALFLSSRQDRIVPPACQDELMDAYAGPKRIVPLADADHMQPLQSEEVQQYLAALNWLRSASGIGFQPVMK